MSRYDKEILEEIKRRIPFPDLYKEYYPELHRENGNSRCCFHSGHANDDSKPSFQLNPAYGHCHLGCTQSATDGKGFDIFALYRCRYGCDFKTALKALADKAGVKLPPGRGKIVKAYDYRDENGTLLYQNCRLDPKDFRQRRPDSDKPGEWIWSLKGVRRVLYRLPEVLQADTVYIVEGEKDSDALHALGLCGTTAPQGADKNGSKWPKLCKDYQIHEALRGKTNYVIPDNDPAGRAHGHTIAASLVGVAKQVKVLNLPDVPFKGDVSDFIQLHGPEQAKHFLGKLAEKTADYDPSTAENLGGDQQGVDAESQFMAALQLFRSTGAEVFLDQHKDGWVCLKDGEVFRNVPLTSAEFRRGLLRLYVDTFQRPVARETIAQVADYLEASATETRHLYVRAAWIDDRLYIDLGNSNWDAIEVDRTGWRIVRLPKPPFRRFSHQQPLPVPAEQGDVDEILDFVSVNDEQSKVLILVWLVCALLEHIPRPALVLHGHQGSGKSTTSEFLRSCVDPSATLTLSLSKDPTEFIQMISHHALLCLDNLHSLPQWASDVICRAITASGFSKRRLYSDDSDVIYQFSRAFILNGINVPGTSPDLLDRSILVELHRMDEESRQEKKSLLSRFEEARSRILAGILSALVKAMNLKGSIQLKRKPRMADFAVWGCAVAEALGIGQQQFISAYYSVINFQHEEILNSEPVCIAVTTFMSDRTSWEGTTTELYAALKTVAEDLNLTKSDGWPKSANWLPRKLNSFADNFAQAGITINRERNRANRRLTITKGEAKKVPDLPSLPSCRHESSNISQLSMTASVTANGSKQNAVTDAVTHKTAPLLPNDSMYSNDSISGNSKGRGASPSEMRVTEWGCQDGCLHFQKNEAGSFCHQLSGDSDLATPGFMCPKTATAASAAVPF